MWEICRVFMPVGGYIHFYSWHDGWGKQKPREYLAHFYPNWLQANPTRHHPEDLIVVLLGNGWEPYAVAEVDAVNGYYFRRKVNS